MAINLILKINYKIFTIFFPIYKYKYYKIKIIIFIPNKKNKL